MREARLKAVEYSALIRKHMEGNYPLMGSRCYYTFSRTQTLACIKQTSPLPFLI